MERLANFGGQGREKTKVVFAIKITQANPLVVLFEPESRIKLVSNEVVFIVDCWINSAGQRAN